MDTAWTLDLLSTRGLDQSILLTVLLGLWLMLLFSETLGWVFVGVVVPGYLASVAVISPASAGAIVCEAIATFVIARALAVTLAKTGVWTQFFGRDRFFLIVLISVWVRQINQTLLLPQLEFFFRNNGYPSLTLTEDFSSIGLVLVPLTANMFWRLNLARGLLQFGTVVGLTYIILRWLLLPYTNLSDASLILLYEDSAIDFMANAKSYIVLLVTAYIASLANLRYGWDFGGILIAALLALLWWTPIKLALTLLEAVFLYGATKALLRIPLIRGLNLEGPRKMVVVFSYSFALKCAIGLFIGDAFPGLKVTDLFAFGYLMSSILVVRMMIVGSMRQVLLPVALTSIFGFCISSLLGLWLAQLSQGLFETPLPPQKSQLVSKRSLSTPAGVLAYASVRRSAPRTWNQASTSRESRRRLQLWKLLGTALSRPRFQLPDTWLSALTRTHMHWSTLQATPDKQPVFLLHPGENQQGDPYDGPIILFRQNATGPSFVVQWPELNPGLAESAWLECLRTDCAALVLFSQSSHSRDRDTPAVLGRQELALMQSLRAARPLWHVVFSKDLVPGKKRLYLDGSVSESHAFLRRDLDYRWSAPPYAASLCAVDQDRILELSSAGRHARIAKHWKKTVKILDDSGLHAYLQSRRQSVLHASANRSTTPQQPKGFSATELRVLERSVAAKLITLSRQDHASPETLAALAFWAQTLGVQLNWLPACGKHGCYVLTLDDPQQGLVWAIARKWEGDNDIEIPRPSREPGTLGLGLSIFEAFDLRSILVHLGDWRYDPTHFGQVLSAYHALHQSLDEQSYASDHSLTFILRGFRVDTKTTQKSEQEVDQVLVGLGYPVLTPIERNKKLERWSSAKGPLGFLGQLRWSDSSQAHYRYSGAQIPQVRYSRLLGKKQPMVLWLPPRVRNRYLYQQSAHWRDLAQALHNGIYGPPSPTRLMELPGIDEHRFLDLTTETASSPCVPTKAPNDQDATFWHEVLDRAETFARYRHPHELFGLVKRLRAKGPGSLRLVRGARSGSVYLAIAWSGATTTYRALVTLGDASEGRHLLYQQGWGQLGPWPSLAKLQLKRTRTVNTLRCFAKSPHRPMLDHKPTPQRGAHGP